MLEYIEEISPKWMVAGLRALLGTPFGLFGIALGGLDGLLFDPQKPPLLGIKIKYPYSNCRAEYNYWTSNIRNFYYPTYR